MAPRFASGQVEVTLGGVAYTLRPTLAAAQALSRAFGGFSPLLSRLREMDLDAYAAVVVQGASLERREAKRVPEAVWTEGMLSLMAPCTEFVMILANGGKPLADEDEAPEEGEGAAGNA